MKKKVFIQPRNIFLLLIGTTYLLTSLHGQHSSQLNGSQQDQYQKATSSAPPIVLSSDEGLTLYLNAIEHLQNGIPEQALENLIAVQQSHFQPFKLNLFLGKAYHQDYKFPQAIKHYKLYRNKLSHHKKQEDLDYVNFLIDQAHFAFEYAHQTSSHELTNANLASNINPNTQKYFMISPKNQQIYFTEPIKSQRNTVALFTLMEHATLGTQKVMVPIAFPKYIQPLQFFNQGNSMLLLNSYTNRFYEIHASEGSWSKPEIIKGIKSMGIVTAASISDNGNAIVYSRLLPSGDMDLFHIMKTNHGWKHPQQLSINSEQQDCFPNLTADGQTLYFSTSRKGSSGGFDIMTSTYSAQSGNWSEPQNIGFPINTPYDELQFAIHPNGRQGMFISNFREAGEKQQIYFFKQTISGYSVIEPYQNQLSHF